MTTPIRVLELFAGIGGVSAAVPSPHRVVAAVDLDGAALDLLATTFGTPTLQRNLAARDLRFLPDADLWWLSPPCQPFTVRGARRDLDDPRCRPLVRVLEEIAARRPTWVAMENVPGFVGSRAHLLVRERLADWVVEESILCPTELGQPNARRRWYLLAGPPRPPRPAPVPVSPPPLRTFLDADPDPALRLPDARVAQYRHALPIAHPDDTHSFCFTSAYGRSPVHCGSVLGDPTLGPRLFSPAEIARLLGFPPSFRFPTEDGYAKAWSWIGNSVSVHAVRHVLAPALGTPEGVG